MASTGKIRVAERVEIEWLHGRTARAICPNCGTDAQMQQLLAVDDAQDEELRHTTLLLCPHCNARFVDDLRVADYETNGLIGLGWPAYYAQIGAGIWPISAPLTRIDKPAGARALEIGGAYGFGVDFCVQARGWQGEGYDPSPLAGIGAQELGLDIRQGYFTAANLTDGPWDVIVSTEVVEHLDQPPAFLALMRQALAADGILMLTTPNAEWITPALPPGELFALLAPRAHLVLQTARSLRLALEQAGFTHVLVLEDAATLVAYASCTPFTLNEDAAAGRAIYRRYLAERATRAAPGSDLHLGFAGRALFDSVNDADAAGVEAAWASLRAGVRARFGYELESLTTLPLGCAGTGLAGLARQIPLGLGMILFSWVMHRLSQGGDRAKLRPVLQLAGEAVSALQAALRLHELGEDRLSVNIGDIVQQELLLCAAEAAEPESVAGLLARGDIVAGWRGFVALVNAGAFTLAAELMDGLLPALPSEDVSAGLRHDALLSLANFYLAPGADAARVFPVAEALGEGGAEILLGGFTRLVNASRYEEAVAVARRYNIPALARGAGAAARDARLTQIVLDLAVGDPAEIPARLQDLEVEPERCDVLLLEAFIRLVNASRYDEALEFITTHDVSALAARVGGEVAKNTGLARMVLDLAVGDPAEIPARLRGLDIDPERRDVLLLEAFIRLVNASRYDEALEFIATHDVSALAARVGGEVAKNTGLARMVLDLAVGDPAEIPARLQDLEVEPERRDALLLEAFIRLVNASRYDEALAFIATHDVSALAARVGGEVAKNTGLARMVLDLAVGDPAEIPARLAGLEIEPERRDVLLLEAFIRLVNASRYDEALKFIATHDVTALAARVGGEVAKNTGLARMVLDLAVGDPAEIPVRLAGLEIEPERRDVLLLEAFIRLANASRYDEALEFIATHDVTALAVRVGGEVAKNTGLARMVLDLAAGDPAEIPARLAGLEIEPEHRDALLLEAFIRLVNASRYDEALAFIATHDVSALAERLGGEVAKNTGLARMVLDLAVGDPAEIPARLRGLDIDPERRDVLLLEAFIRLVNASRYDEALEFITTHDVTALAVRVGGEVAKNTGLARMVLDLAVGDPAEIPVRLQDLEVEPERRDVLLLEAFIRLVNASRYDEALAFITTHRVPELLRSAGTKTGADAAIALAVLELELGDPALVPGHLAGLDVPPERAEALILGTFTELVNTARYDEAEVLAAAEPCFARLPDMQGEAAADARFATMMLDLQRGRVASAVEKMAALERTGTDAAALNALYVDAFIRLVNDGDFALARQMAEEVGVERRLPHCAAPARQDALVALLLQELQPGGNAARVPDRVTALRPTQISAAHLRKLTLIAFTTLVNQQEITTARALLAPVEPELLTLHPPFDPAGRDALFAAGALYLEDEQEWRRSATCFGRLRDGLAKSAPPGMAPEPLFWPALRGEVVALHRLERYEEATLLLREFIGTYPDAPEDLRQQIEPHETLNP